MVCSFGEGRMAVMAKLLVAGSCTQTVADEVGHQRAAAQFVQREICEANEANLLDEEDMHVFDLKPMKDPLHLVCCSACKKPIKASQYAAHAERCKSLMSLQAIVPERHGGARQKKPPRKEKKKALTVNGSTSGGEQDKTDSVEIDDAVTSESLRFDKSKLPPTFLGAEKDGTLAKEGSVVNCGSPQYPTGESLPPTKRLKLITAQSPPVSDHLETASAVSKSLSVGGEFPMGKVSSGWNREISAQNVGCQKPDQSHVCCLPSKEVPAPLATKMFYSQRNHRLRSAITYLYYEACSEEEIVEPVIPTAFEGDTMLLKASSPNYIPESFTIASDKYGNHSDVYSSNIGGYSQSQNITDRRCLDKPLRPKTTPSGILRTNLSRSSAFPGESGMALGSMQQPKGSVPVT